MAKSYLYGENGVERDEEAGFEWCLQAAVQLHDEAIRQASFCCGYRVGTPQDIEASRDFGKCGWMKDKIDDEPMIKKEIARSVMKKHSKTIEGKERFIENISHMQEFFGMYSEYAKAITLPENKESN